MIKIYKGFYVPFCAAHIVYSHQQYHSALLHLIQVSQYGQTAIFMLPFKISQRVLSQSEKALRCRQLLAILVVY